MDEPQCLFVLIKWSDNGTLFVMLKDNSNEGRKKRKLMEGCKKEAVGFTLPVEPIGLGERSPLPTLTTGPPYFYYENIKHAPKGVWETMSRFLYDIKPEFVDSQFISAAMRKRGYIHNLPVQNRSAVDPLPPMTIFEAFPQYKKWWPSWDSREKLNCIRTFLASSKTVKKICSTLEENTNPPPPAIQKYVIEECKKGNLVWTGKNKVAPLEPREMEVLLGFPKGHTRSMGFRERHRALGNSFQVDTVAYHLSVLKDIFPNGMNVLSLFSGIGGAEVALHRLGIHLKNVVIVEKCKTSRDVVKDWWEGNKITGDLIEIEDVKELTTDKIEEFIMRFHGFDLVIGGSPCNNLAGSNRYSRIGLEGVHSSLFYDYVRILDDVRSAMWRISQG
jgi:site-specific DNA-cytosine methylase